MREAEKITIGEDTFVAEPLFPNYKGEYDCKCENCAFNIYWAIFGRMQHCDKVKCVQQDFNEGNRNVWSRVGGLDGVEPWDVPYWHVEYDCNYVVDCEDGENICRAYVEGSTVVRCRERELVYAVREHLMNDIYGYVFLEFNVSVVDYWETNKEEYEEHFLW
jgi:hypothetical protein